MSPADIKGTQLPVAKVFSNDFFFEVPHYQRPYAWTTEESGDLLDDLLTFMGDDDRPIPDLNPYFLGSIVLIKDEDEADARIVDGQQRLTTLTILLACLRELVAPEFAEELTTYLYAKGKKLENIPNRYRLTLRPRDEDFFQNYVQNEGNLDKLRELNGSLTDSHRNIRNNTLHLLSNLQALASEQRVRLAEFIVTRCYLVVVSTPDPTSAYRIFQVLNDRGLDLSYTDILKAEILGEIPEPEQDEYVKKWEDVEDQLGRERFQSLFARIRTIRRKLKPRELILEEIRKYVRPAAFPKRFIDETLIPMADAFAEIRRASYQSATGADEVNKSLRWLNWVDNADWIPPAILYFVKCGDNPTELSRFLRDLERLATGLMILRRNVNKRIERYGSLLSAIEGDEELFEESSPLQLTAEEREAIVKTLDGDMYNVAPRLPVLLRLDAALAAGGASYNYPIITVEHVLPQNPRDDSKWLTRFPDTEERIELTHKLGNLVLLSRRKNAQAQNFDFEKKKKEYFQRKGAANFALTNQVLSYETWTPEVVKNRQKELLGKLKEVWQL